MELNKISMEPNKLASGQNPKTPTNCAGWPRQVVVVSTLFDSELKFISFWVDGSDAGTDTRDMATRAKTIETIKQTIKNVWACPLVNEIFTTFCSTL